MAGRNQKNIADWFSHDADASSDEKVVYLESLFGPIGYAVYFKFLECMTRSEDFKLKWDAIKKAVYASKFGISVTEINRFITESCREEIKAFVIEDGYLFSPGLVKRLEPLLAKREYNRQKYQEQKQKIINSETERAKSVTELTQSKGKESKEKNIYTHLFDYLNSKIQNGFLPHQNKIIEFYKYRMAKPKKDRYATEKGIDGLFRDISGCKSFGYPIGQCIDVAMENNWQSPKPHYYEKMNWAISKTSNLQQKPLEDCFK